MGTAQIRDEVIWIGHIECDPELAQAMKDLALNDKARSRRV
jgi:hypothetical protein